MAGPGPPHAGRVLRERRARGDVGGHDADRADVASGRSTRSRTCEDRSEYWLGQQGRLVEPVHKPAGSDHYEPISWADAFRLVADRLTRPRLARPGRVLHERPDGQRDGVRLPAVRARVRHQQPARLLEHVPRVDGHRDARDASASGSRPIAYDDFAKSDLIIVMGQNPGTNHPRMLGALEDAKRNGAAIVAVNPLPEAGLRRFKNPKTVRGLVGRGTDLADQFLQIRSGGDMALLQWVSRRVLEAEDRAPGHRPGPRLPGPVHPGSRRVPRAPRSVRRGRRCSRRRACRSRRWTSSPTATSRRTA